jgi:hypothetical protein
MSPLLIDLDFGHNFQDSLGNLDRYGDNRIISVVEQDLCLLHTNIYPDRGLNQLNLTKP